MIKQKNAYKHEELIECAKGNMFGEGNAQLPNTGMLMFDEIIEISSSGGLYDKGFICLLYTSPSPRDRTRSRMPSSA